MPPKGIRRPKGKIKGLDITLLSNAGNVCDLSAPVMSRALTHLDNCYSFKNFRARGYICKTNTVSNKAFRGFVGPQGMLAIENILDNKGASLSGGERRRVEIARALSIEPKFLLLDEPFAGIDPISVIEIQKIIKSLTKSDIGVLITDHNVRETLKVCDESYILSDGKVISFGKSKEIIKDSLVKKVYLGEDFRL